MYSYTRVFLEQLGFTGWVSGLVLALASIFSVALQPPIAELLSRSEKLSLRLVIALILGVVLLSGLLLLFPKGGWLVIVLFLMLGTATLTVQPFINSVGFTYINKGEKLNFALSRGVASLSYAAISKLMSYLSEKSNAAMLLCFLTTMSLLFVQNLFMAQKGPAVAVREEKARGSISAFIKRYPAFCMMLMGQMFIFCQHNIINGYIWDVSLYVGGDAGTMGTALLIGALVEVPAFFLFDRLLRRIPCHGFLKAAAVFYVVKPLLILINPTVPFFYLSQSMQAITYAFMMPGMAYYTNALLLESDRIRGQALVTSSIAVAGFIGYLAGGVMMDTIGIANSLWMSIAVGALGSTLLFLFSKPLPKGV